jgi:hypothetical protein
VLTEFSIQEDPARVPPCFIKELETGHESVNGANYNMTVQTRKTLPGRLYAPTDFSPRGKSASTG